MPFTDIYKSYTSFGTVSGSLYGVLSSTPDQVYSIDNAVKYYNKKCPIFVNVVPTLNLSSAGRFYTGIISPDSSHTGDYKSCTYTSISFVNDKVVVRYSISNSTSSDFSVKSFCLTGTPYVFSNTSGGSGSSSITIPLVYLNFDSDIVVPANDSVFVDITLSAGDISSVQAG